MLRDRMIVFIILVCSSTSCSGPASEQAGTSSPSSRTAMWTPDDAAALGDGRGHHAVLLKPAVHRDHGRSVFSMLWVYLNRIGKNPNIPVKFGIRHHPPGHGLPGSYRRPQ